MHSQRSSALKASACAGLAQKTQVLFAKTALGCQPQDPAELGVIAQLRVRIQWLVVSKQADVMLEKQRQSLLHPADNAPILPFPKQTMVDKNGLRLGGYRRLDQGPTRRHPRDDFSNPVCAFDLQSVGAVILKTFGL